MEIIAHRGLWELPHQKNSVAAIRSAVENGFGVETDLRDHNGKLVVSHDLPSDTAPDFQELIESLSALPDFDKVSWALNVKADGLQTLIIDVISRFKLRKAFCFDMSVPDGLGYLTLSNCCEVYTRQSEYETAPPFYQKADGVWLDEFDKHWINGKIIAGHLRKQKKVCIVSPELHNREHLPFWQELREFGKVEDGRLKICTDFPVKAREFFND